MKLKKTYKIASILAIFLIFIAIISIQFYYSKQYCSEIKIILKSHPKKSFISENFVIDYLNKKIDKKIVGNIFWKIDMNKIEKEIYNIPYIKNAEVYRDKNNILYIQIEQFEPIAKIFDSKQNYFIITKEGYILKGKTGLDYYLPVFNGNIPPIKITSRLHINDTSLKQNIYKRIYELSIYLTENEYAQNLFDQIYITKDTNFIIIPKIGSFIIEFGDEKNFEEKVNNLKAFYTIALPRVGWDKYSKINLTYKNQIVCTKKS